MTETHSLLELSRHCFMAVGPVRIAACALTILDDSACETDVGRTRFETAQSRVLAAQHMLDHGFPGALRLTGHAMSPKLAETHEAAKACVTTLADALSQTSGTLAHRMGGSEAFRDYFFEALEPRVTDFLTHMTQELTAGHSAQMEAQRANALQAIQNADNVGRAISLIAVNAAIEAARSGDNGFKVIADEIKSLAAKTQGLIREVGKAMQQG